MNTPVDNEIQIDLYADGYADGKADGRKIERTEVELQSTLAKVRWTGDHYEVWPIDEETLRKGLYRMLPVPEAVA